MYVIVVGGGKVGFYLAKELVANGFEVLIIEKDNSRCDSIAEELGDIVLRGDGCEVTTMDIAGFSRADMAIAVTGDDEDNLVVCQVAKARFNIPRSVARINNPKNEEIFGRLGIETTVSATSAILSQIAQELPEHSLISLMTIKGGGLELVEVKIPADSAVVGRKIKDLPLPKQSLVSLIIDESGEPRVPSNDTTVCSGDELVMVTSRKNEDDLRDALTAKPG